MYVQWWLFDSRLIPNSNFPTNLYPIGFLVGPYKNALKIVKKQKECFLTFSPSPPLWNSSVWAWERGTKTQNRLSTEIPVSEEIPVVLQTTFWSLKKSNILFCLTKDYNAVQNKLFVITNTIKLVILISSAGSFYVNFPPKMIR